MITFLLKMDLADLADLADLGKVCPIRPDRQAKPSIRRSRAFD